MAQGLVRKLIVCFFQEGEHVDQAPIERVVFELQVGGGSDDCADDRQQSGRKSGEDNALDPIRLQVCTSGAFCFQSEVSYRVLHVLRFDTVPSRLSGVSIWCCSVMELLGDITNVKYSRSRVYLVLFTPQGLHTAYSTDSSAAQENDEG